MEDLTLDTLVEASRSGGPTALGSVDEAAASGWQARSCCPCKVHERR